MTLKAPFPAFGGKSAIAGEIWKRFGTVRNYVEPFCNSCAVLLARPEPFDGTETVNDYDGLIANFWRAVKHDPDAVAFHADWPVNENDLHARHSWLVGQKEQIQSRLEGDPDFYDAKIAGWWCWGCCCWIAGGWCSGKGPWQVQVVDGVRHLVRLGHAGKGVKRQLVHLRDAGKGVTRQLVHLMGAGKGVTRQLVNLGDAGKGDESEACGVYGWMQALADRLARVRVCCGDWSRVCGPTVTVRQGLSAVFLDPPYSAEANRDNNLYCVESLDVAHECRKWCEEVGSDPKMRICLAGYAGEGHESLESLGWVRHEWKAQGGYSNRGSKSDKNCRKERLWFSPHCVPAKAKAQQLDMQEAFA